MSRDRAAWAKRSLYSKDIGERIELLADIQHEPISLETYYVERLTDAWIWLHKATGFARCDLPKDASWGQRWKQEIRTAELEKAFEEGRMRI